VAKRVPVTSTFADGDVLPGRVQAIAMHHMDEAAFWLPGHSSLVLGDSVLGYDGRAELSPASWLREGESVAEHRASVERALVLGPHQLLLTHGGPRARDDLQL
jgi:glyoxylase-like metal-dependent hydrolase (beta-lactamase superfamily II)